MRLSYALVPAVLALAPAAMADTFHVTTGGSDTAAGTAEAPWRTLQHAADRVVAGDTVIVHAGTYQGFNLENSGLAGAEIAFVAEGTVRIDRDNAVTPDGINLEGASFVQIEGFTVEGASRAGIRAALCQRVTLRNNRAHANGRWGIFTAFCDDLLIEGNECSRSADEHGIYVSNSGDRPVIRGNILWSNHANGLHMNGDITQGGDGVITGAVVDGNVIFDNGAAGGSGINGDGVVSAVIKNNLLYGNHASGISLYQIDGGSPANGNLVINNTVVMAADGRWAVNIQDGSTNNVLRNNILLHRGDRGAVDLCATCTTGFSSDFNVVTGVFTRGDQVIDLAAWRATGWDASSLEATEADLFVDPTADDYVLRAGAPAIDRGTPDQAPPADLAGNARPQGSGVDIGALEFCTGPCAPPPRPGATGEEGGGCGCAGSAPTGGGAWIVVLALVARRRRRAGA